MIKKEFPDTDDIPRADLCVTHAEKPVNMIGCGGIRSVKRASLGY